MAQPFPYTLRSLRNDSGRAVALGLIALLAAAVVWNMWLFRAQLTVYEVSKKTRLEVRGAAFPIHTATAGKLATIEVKLGQKIKKGALMFKLDAIVELQQLATSRARLAAIDLKTESVGGELRATRGAVKAEVAAGGAAAKQAKARSREADIQAQLAQREAERYKRLSAAVSQIEFERIAAQAEIRRANFEAQSLDVRRLRSEQRTRRRTGDVRVAALRREMATLEGERQTLQAQVAELEQVIERRIIRAPEDGLIGELAPLHVGSYVAEGAKLATLMPTGELMLVAELEPASALGRVRPGQHAELRLTGFPWLEFGTVNARVTQVATEVRDGTVRVELDLLHDQKSLIPFQHGLPGSVEIAVEHITPAELLLRSLGRRLDGASARQVSP